MAPNHIIGHAQICVIARQVYTRSMTDADWVSALKDSLARQGYQWSGPDALTRAIRAVEVAHGRDGAIKGLEPVEAVPEPPGFTRAEAASFAAQWKADPDPTLLDLAREAVRLHPGTDWRRCHVQLKAMETAALSAGITFTWGLLSVALIKAQREMVLESRLGSLGSYP